MKPETKPEMKSDVRPDIFIFDELQPEDNAMVQALYSRSPRSVVQHMQRVQEVGSGAFMSQYYVGYGHASIGDCGSTTLYFENVSMLFAKALQDHPLYSGQEASTRYLNFEEQPQIDPYDHPASKAILRGWLALYSRTLPKVKAALAKVYPFDPAQYKSEGVWDKAIAARAFDTVRSLLPLGTGTLASWHTNLRQARDHLRRMIHHPLPEVRDNARRAYDGLCAKYPHSFSHEDIAFGSERHAQRYAYAQENAFEDHILTPEALLVRLSQGQRDDLLAGKVVGDASLLDMQRANILEKKLFSTRPKGAPLPRRLTQYGVYNIFFPMDFGSFRDIQRHRNSYTPVPLVGADFGFYPWYLEEMGRLLSSSEFEAVMAEIYRLIQAVKTLGEHGVETKPELDQYLYPMGMTCLCQMTYSIAQMVYVAELRSSPMVHPSLRPLAHALGKILHSTLPDLKVYVDTTPDSFSIRRGQQDIVAKAGA